MSKEFKVGDKVRALASSASGGFLEGYIYEVSNIYKNYSDERIEVALDSLGVVNDWLSDNFELVESFDDLIDVVVKAYKNRLLDIFLMNDEVITVFNYDATRTKEGINRSDTSKYYQFINFINSLYTETFVIEDNEDMSELKIGDKFDQNGTEIVIDKYMIDELKHVPLFLTIGAKVTRQKGNK